MTREIPLTQGKVALVDDEAHESLSVCKWFAGKNRSRFYARRRRPAGQPGSQYIRMHRIILAAPPDMEVHHLNGNTLDNRRCNLCLCTHREHEMTKGKRPGCSSKWKGVSWHKARGKWAGQIEICDKRQHLGYFIDEDDAARVYDEAAKELFGEFARLNFPAEAQE